MILPDDPHPDPEIDYRTAILEIEGVGRAAFYGLVATWLALLFFDLTRDIGLSSFDPELLAGSMLTQTLGLATRSLGIVVISACGLVVGCIYKLALVGKTRAGWRAGVRLGLFHWLGTGLFLGSLTAIHPLVPERLAAPGFFGSKLGPAGALMILVGHLFFGAIEGAFLRPPKQNPQNVRHDLAA